MIFFFNTESYPKRQDASAHAYFRIHACMHIHILHTDMKYTYTHLHSFNPFTTGACRGNTCPQAPCNTAAPPQCLAPRRSSNTGQTC